MGGACNTISSGANASRLNYELQVVVQSPNFYLKYEKYSTQNISTKV